MTLSRPSTAARRDYYEELAARRLAPLWESLADLVPREPRSQCKAAFWRYADLRPFIDKAGELISAQEAERRVLVLENPAYPGQHRITNTLYGGFQLLLPGEEAASHRHSQSAMRFIIEGDGAYTAVNGEKFYMHRGDVILTPAWTWHDHGNPGNEPTVWFDALDIPIVADLGAGFRESGDEEGNVDAPMPARAPGGARGNMPFAYPYARARESLEVMRRRGDLDPCHGVIQQYINPATGGSVLPTISAFLQLVPGGQKTLPYRSTASTTFIAVEGAGRTQVGDEIFEWSANDVLVVPSWAASRHEVDRDAVLFGYSDRAVQEKLGLWRERRGN